MTPDPSYRTLRPSPEEREKAARARRTAYLLADPARPSGYDREWLILYSVGEDALALRALFHWAADDDDMSAAGGALLEELLCGEEFRVQGFEECA